MNSLKPKLRIGVLASGEGTTLQAILDACAEGELDAEVGLVIGNNRDSGALRKAAASKVKVAHLSSATHPDAGDLDRAVLAALLEANVRLVVLAGYMKKLGAGTLSAFAGRVVNTHPALLPKYGGQGMFGHRVHEAVLAAGESETGVTVHMVDGEYDHGEIIAQTVVPVLVHDTVETLSTRVQQAERVFLIRTLQRFASREAVRRFGIKESGRSYRIRPAAYVVVIDEGRRVACVAEKSGLFLPGGGIEPGEDAVRAAHREVDEECARTLEIVSPPLEPAVQFFIAPRGEAYELHATFFRARFGPVLRRSEDPVRWLSAVPEAPSFFHECHRWAVQQALQKT